MNPNLKIRNSTAGNSNWVCSVFNFPEWHLYEERPSWIFLNDSTVVLSIQMTHRLLDRIHLLTDFSDWYMANIFLVFWYMFRQRTPLSLSHILSFFDVLSTSYATLCPTSFCVRIRLNQHKYPFKGNQERLWLCERTLWKVSYSLQLCIPGT